MKRVGCGTLVITFQLLGVNIFSIVSSFSTRISVTSVQATNEEHSYAMERNRSKERDRSKDLERSNVKMFTHF